MIASRLFVLTILGLMVASSLITVTYSNSLSSSVSEKVSVRALDKSYVTCYCWDVALIKGGVYNGQSLPVSDRKVTVYCNCVCNYSLVQNEKDYYPGVNLDCTWKPNVGWHALLSYNSSGKLVPWIKTNSQGVFRTIIYDFLNSNTTAPYYGTTYHFYAIDDVTNMKSSLTSYLST